MSQHPPDELEALRARDAALAALVTDARLRALATLEALPGEDVQALYMLPRWGTPDELAGAAYRAARWAVATAHSRDPDGAPVARLDELTDVERAHLHDLVTTRACVAHKALERLPHAEGGRQALPELPAEGGMLAWTAGVLAHLEAYLAKCADAPAEDLAWMREQLDKARTREADAWQDGDALAFWHLRAGDLDRGPAWLNLVALAVWTLEVAPRVTRARRPVAMTLANIEGITAGLAHRGTVEVLGPRGGDATPTRPNLWVEVNAAALDSAALDRIQRGTGMLGSPLAPRMLTLLANRIQRRLDPHAPLVWEGGGGRNAWEVMAMELGIHDPQRARQEVRPLFETLGSLHYRSPTGLEVGGLWTYALENERGGRGKVGRITVTPNAVICGTVRDTDTDRADRFLVPLPELPGWCAPMVGRPNEHGAYARLWLWTLCRLREHAEDIHLGTGVLIDGATWAGAGLEVGLRNPEPLLVPHGLIARWTRDGDDGRAVLEEVTPNRYHLAPHLEAERAMLDEAGRRSIQGRKGGKVAAERRAHPTKRPVKKPRGF